MGFILESLGRRPLFEKFTSTGLKLTVHDLNSHTGRGRPGRSSAQAHVDHTARAGTAEFGAERCL